MPEKEAEASWWWYCYSIVVYTALDLDYFLLKTWWEPGIVDCSESLSLFHLLTPIGQRLVVVFVCVLGGLFAFCLFSVPDLSFWYRCLTMTILAQFNDCHCCNDARSLVQKKRITKCCACFSRQISEDWKCFYWSIFSVLIVRRELEKLESKSVFWKRKLSRLWGCCDGTFHMFHQVLDWSSCLRSPTNRHAVVRLGRSFHRTHLVIYGSINL